MVLIQKQIYQWNRKGNLETVGQVYGLLIYDNKQKSISCELQCINMKCKAIKIQGGNMKEYLHE